MATGGERYLIKAGGTHVVEATDIWDLLNWPNHPNGDGGGCDALTGEAYLMPHVTGDFTLGGAMACATFYAVAFPGTIALAANDLDTTGTCYFGAGAITGSGDIYCMKCVTFDGVDTSGWSGALIHDGDATPGAHTLLTNGVTIPGLTINNNGVDSLTLQDNLTVGDLTYTAGKFTTTGRTVTLVAGGVTSDVNWNSTGYPLAHLVVPTGAKAGLVGNLRIEEITFGAGVDGVSVAGGAWTTYLYAGGDDKLHQSAASGTVTGQQLFVLVGGNIELGYLDASGQTAGVLLRGDSGANRTVTMTGPWTTGTKALAMYANGAAQTTILDTNHKDLTAGAVTLGRAAAEDKSGAMLARSGKHSFISILAGDGANENNAYDFGTGQTRLSTADNDFSDIAITAGGGQLVANSINHCDVTGLLRAWAVKDGGDNVNVEWQPRQIGMMPLAA